MIAKKLTDLTQITSTAANDLAIVVDVSDVTDDPAGSSRKVKLSDLLNSTNVPYVTSGFSRALAIKLGDRISAKDYGAFADGGSHPLSSVYSMLAAAQAAYPRLTLTDLTPEIDWCAIQSAIETAHATGACAVSIPAGTGSYIINRTITFGTAAAPYNNMTVYGDGTGVYDHGTTIKRNADVVGVAILGQNITSPFSLISRICMEGILFDGGDNAGSGPHYVSDMMTLKAAYECYFTNCRWNSCNQAWITATQLWDSRFINCTFTFGGSADGLHAGVQFISNAVGYEFTNNVYFYGCRFESNPGVSLSSVGNNASSYYFTDCKFENVFDQLDYLVKLNQASFVTFKSTWMYVNPSSFGGISWSSSSSATVALGSVTLTIATGLTNIPINRYVVAFSTVDPTNWMSGYVTAYDAVSGIMSFTADYKQGGGTASSWTLAPMHPGLIYATGCRTLNGDIHGGNVSFGGAPASVPYQKCFVHIDNTTVVDLDVDLAAGTDLLPATTFQAWSDPTTTAFPTGGAFTFTIQTGLTISNNTPLYIMGNSFSTRSNWMIGHVTGYDSGTGVLNVRVDNFHYDGGTTTGWTITKFGSSPVVFTNQPLTNVNTNIRIKGGSQLFGFATGSNISQVNPQMQGLSLLNYGSPTLLMRDINTDEDWTFRIDNDPTTVGGNIANTGKFSLQLFDYQRGQFYTPWYISGGRDMVLQDSQLLLRNNLWWFDSTTSRNTKIVGAYSTPPANSPQTFFNNSIIWNSHCTIGNPVGWVMLDETQIDASGWQPFGKVTTLASPQVLISGSTVAWDAKTFPDAFLNLASNATLSNPTNMASGGKYTLRVVQAGGGSHTLAYGTAFKWAAGTPPVITTANGAIDVLTFTSDGTSMYGTYAQHFS